MRVAADQGGEPGAMRITVTLLYLAALLGGVRLLAQPASTNRVLELDAGHTVN